jgi:hypothetical protein
MKSSGFSLMLITLFQVLFVYELQNLANTNKGSFTLFLTSLANQDSFQIAVALYI